MARAIESVQGAKVVVAPKRGTGDKAQTFAVVELSGKASVGAVTSAVEAAKTPHSSQVAPGVSGVIPAKVKSTATPEALLEALKKADLLEP